MICLVNLKLIVVQKTDSVIHLNAPLFFSLYLITFSFTCTAKDCRQRRSSSCPSCNFVVAASRGHRSSRCRPSQPRSHSLLALRFHFHFRPRRTSRTNHIDFQGFGFGSLRHSFTGEWRGSTLARDSHYHPHRMDLLQFQALNQQDLRLHRVQREQFP